MREKNIYTREQLEFLHKAYRGLHVHELTAVFNRVFRTDKTEAAIRSALKNHGITCNLAYKYHLFGGPIRLLTAKQNEFIEKHYLRCGIKDLTRRVNRQFGLDLRESQLRSFVRNHAIQSGRTGRFANGHRPFNKGMKGWQAGGRSAETRFKTGNRPQTWVPVGSTRVIKDGILQRKISDTGYTPRDWQSVHSMLWEEHHGPVPKGHIVVFRDGNNKNICIENLELISMTENMRRNSIHRLPEALADVCRIRGVLNRHINKSRQPNEK
jgi:hypothetical protein